MTAETVTPRALTREEYVARVTELLEARLEEIMKSIDDVRRAAGEDIQALLAKPYALPAGQSTIELAESPNWLFRLHKEEAASTTGLLDRCEHRMLDNIRSISTRFASDLRTADKGRLPVLLREMRGASEIALQPLEEERLTSPHAYGYSFSQLFSRAFILPVRERNTATARPYMVARIGDMEEKHVHLEPGEYDPDGREYHIRTSSDTTACPQLTVHVSHEEIHAFAGLFNKNIQKLLNNEGSFDARLLFMHFGEYGTMLVPRIRDHQGERRSLLHDECRPRALRTGLLSDEERRAWTVSPDDLPRAPLATPFWRRAASMKRTGAFPPPPCPLPPR